MMDIKQNPNEAKMTFQKNADKKRNRIIIPQFFINNWGSRFYMDIYNDKIILRPIKKEEGK